MKKNNNKPMTTSEKLRTDQHRIEYTNRNSKDNVLACLR